MTFSIALVLLDLNVRTTLCGALIDLKGLFFRVSYLKVLVSDKDIALMDAIKIVFLEAFNMLCCFHMDKNVKPKCKMLVCPREA